MDVSGQALHKYICLLVLECYYVIRLVGIKQIPSFLLSYNRLKRFLFLPWEGWGIWILPGWGEEFEPELSSLFSKIDMFYFLVWRCLKVWSFQKCKCLRSCQGGRRDVETLNWLKHYWGLWKEGSVSWSFKGELKFIQSIFCRKWLNFNFKHFLDFMTKIIGSQSIFGFSEKLFAVPTFQSGFLIFFRLEKHLNYNILGLSFIGFSRILISAIA